MKYIKRIYILLNLVAGFLLFGTGFVVEAANPVSVMLSDCTDNFSNVDDSGKIYRLRIYLKEKEQINAFQFKVDFDNSVLQLYDEVKLSDDILKKYNQNNSAMVSCKYNEKKSNIIMLGVQVDNNLATLESGTVISDVFFRTTSTDAGECAKQLESVKFSVEVLEGENGNVVDSDSSWTIYANHNVEQNVVSEEDLREDVGKYSQNSDSKNNGSAGTQTNDNVSGGQIKNNSEVTQDNNTHDENASVLNEVQNGNNSENNSSASGVAVTESSDTDKVSENIAENKTNDKNCNIISKKKAEKNDKNNIRIVVYIIFGMAIIAAVVVLSVFNRKNIKELLPNHKK